MRLLYLIVLIILSINICTSRRFRLGRSKWGNLGIPAETVNMVTPPEMWFVQKLDHYSPTDQRSWQQRYFINDTFYDMKSNNGPVFLMIGGEGPADPRWMLKGAWIEYAEKLQALCIMLEHRYYGKSHPRPNMSVKNLQYLNSSQALADLARFIQQMNVKFGLGKYVKWIAFGGSYPGSLAAWLRLKYPHLVYAAISSSGPLTAKMDFEEYFKVVVASLYAKTGNSKCIDTVKKAHSELTLLIPEQPKIIEESFKLCKPLKDASALDMKAFYNNIADVFAEVVQYNEDNRMTVDVQYQNITINTICNMLEGTSKPDYVKLASVITLMLEREEQSCLDYSYDNMIKALQSTTWTNHDGGRQWYYQTCTEFGFYQTLTGEAVAFGDDCDLQFYVQQCQDIFGPKFNVDFISAAVNYTNNYYGANDIAATRVLYVQGSIDPWHALGLIATRDASSPVIYIEGTAHCANMYPSSARDSTELQDARAAIYKQLKEWTSSPHEQF